MKRKTRSSALELYQGASCGYRNSKATVTSQSRKLTRRASTIWDFFFLIWFYYCAPRRDRNAKGRSGRAEGWTILACMHTRTASGLPRSLPEAFSNESVLPRETQGYGSGSLSVHMTGQKSSIFTLPILSTSRRCEPRASPAHPPEIIPVSLPRYSASHLPSPKRAFRIQMKDQSVLSFVMLQNVETTGRDADQIPARRPQTSCPCPPPPSGPRCPSGPHGSMAPSISERRSKTLRHGMACPGRLVIT
jgi:hypothetical protein